MWQVLNVGAAYWAHFLFLAVVCVVVVLQGRWFERGAVALWFLPQRYIPWCRVAECTLLTTSWLWIGADVALSALCIWGAYRVRQWPIRAAAAFALLMTATDLVALIHPALARWAYGSYANPWSYLAGAALLISAVLPAKPGTTLARSPSRA